MKQTDSSRRSFIGKVALGSLATLSIPEIVSASMALEKPKKVLLSSNDIILFQGDSITDSGRNRKDDKANISNGLGNGYAYLAASNLLLEHPKKNLQIYNRGISGNKVFQLADFWEADALSLKPNVLSILVGINDYWHTLSHGYKGTVKTYKTDYRTLLSRTKDRLPGTKIIIGEPFAIIGTAVTQNWFSVLKEYQNSAKELAAEFNAVFIPYQEVFNKAVTKAPGAYWSGDGVHPSIAGSALMAEAWLQTIQG